MSSSGERRDTMMAARSGSRGTQDVPGVSESKRTETALSVAAVGREPVPQKGAARSVPALKADAEAKPAQVAAAADLPAAKPVSAPGQPVTTQVQNAQARNVQNQAQDQRAQSGRPAQATQQAAAGAAQQPKQIQVATQAAAGGSVLKE